MSRSGYSYDCDSWELIRWRGAVASAVRGKRGQALLREMAAALDAMPVKELVAEDLITPDGGCCAFGAVAMARGVTYEDLPESTFRFWDPFTLEILGRRERQVEFSGEQLAEAFDVAPALACEIVSINDDYLGHAKDEHARATRWWVVRNWIARHLNDG